MKRKEPKSTIVSGDNKPKSMILSLDPTKHAWIKSIAEATDMSQPNVVNLVLAKAVNEPSSEYIDEIKKMNAEQSLKQLDERQKAIDLERQRLKDMLE